VSGFGPGEGAGYDAWKAAEPDLDVPAGRPAYRNSGGRDPHHDCMAERDRLGAQLFRARLVLARAVAFAEGAGEADDSWVAQARKCLEEPAP